MLTFDKQALGMRLQGMSSVCRCLFAISCAERLYPLYESYHERTGQADVSHLRSTLDQLWDTMIQGEKCRALSFLHEYESLIPGEDVPWTLLNPLTENAIAAVVYACQCQAAHETENAVWAAVQAYEAVDYIAHTLEGIDFQGPESEAVILNNEYVQGEIEKQLRDVAELEKCNPDDRGFVELARTFRTRAKSEGESLAPILSRLST